MNLFLNSGDMVTLHNLDSFENFIEEQLGPDIMIVFRNMINNQIGEIENLQFDYDIQCESTKNLDCVRQQAMEELENTIDYIKVAINNSLNGVFYSEYGFDVKQ